MYASLGMGIICSLVAKFGRKPNSRAHWPWFHIQQQYHFKLFNVVLYCFKIWHSCHVTKLLLKF